jgi:hypothetical protein
MEPVRIKLYGLFKVTRRGYLVQLMMALVMLTVLLAIRYLMPPVQLQVKNDEMSARGRFLIALLANLHWVVAGFALLFGLEAWIVLRRFARLEAQLRKPGELPASPPPPPAPAPSERTG